MSADDVGTVVYQAAAGDERAWQTLVEDYSRMLTKIGRSFRLSSEQIEDVAQDTWLELFRSIGTVREPARIAGWLAKAMARGCLRARRRLDREVLDGALAAWDLIDPESDVEEQVLRTERRVRLSQAVDRLPDRQREVVTALATCDSYRGVVAALNIPVGSIGPTRARALDRLRSDLGGEGDGWGLLDAS